MKLPKIKASSVTNLTDARYFAARGVEWLGFDFQAGSQNFIEEVKAAAIKEWLEGVKYIGEFGFVNQASTVFHTASQLQLDAIEVNMLVEWELVEALGVQTPVFREYVVAAQEDFGALAQQLEVFSGAVLATILNFNKNAWTWAHVLGQQQALAALCRQNPVYLALDLAPEELQECVALFEPEGLVVTGGQEEKIGVKSFDALDEWFDAFDDLM